MPAGITLTQNMVEVKQTERRRLTTWLGGMKEAIKQREMTSGGENIGNPKSCHFELQTKCAQPVGLILLICLLGLFIGLVPTNSS